MLFDFCRDVSPALSIASSLLQRLLAAAFARSSWRTSHSCASAALLSASSAIAHGSALLSGLAAGLGSTREPCRCSRLEAATPGPSASSSASSRRLSASAVALREQTGQRPLVTLVRMAWHSGHSTSVGLCHLWESPSLAIILEQAASVLPCADAMDETGMVPASSLSLSTSPVVQALPPTRRRPSRAARPTRSSRMGS